MRKARHGTQARIAGRWPEPTWPNCCPWIVALPSRFESFSLAAQEVRGLGLSVIIPNLAALEDSLGEEIGPLRRRRLQSNCWCGRTCCAPNSPPLPLPASGSQGGIARGNFAGIDEPLVSIVIPCFNQGRI
jgi:hypothetical protein